MSIASEITRLQGVKSDILQAIADKGVEVPLGSKLDDCPGLIASIPTGTPAIPDSYKRVLYIELTGAGADAYAYYHSPSIFRNGDMGGLSSLDTVEMDVFIPNTQGLVDGNLIYLWESFGPWSDARGYCNVGKDSASVRFQSYRELTDSSLDNLGRFLSIKRSAREVRPGESVPTGYNYVGQISVNGILTELDIYGDVQPIYDFVQYMTIFADEGSNIPNTVIGTKVFRLETKKYGTGKTTHNLIPCIRVSDSKPGFYEPTYDRFVTSVNNGVWAAGPIV